MKQNSRGAALIIALIILVLIGFTVSIVFQRKLPLTPQPSTQPSSYEECVKSKDATILGRTCTTKDGQQFSEPGPNRLLTPPLYPGIKWGPVNEGQFETYDKDGPAKVQGYIVQSEPLSPEGPYGMDIHFELYQPWLEQNSWQGYADFTGAGSGFLLGWKKNGKYFIYSKEKTNQSDWILVIRYN